MSPTITNHCFVICSEFGAIDHLIYDVVVCRTHKNNMEIEGRVRFVSNMGMTSYG